VIWDFVLDRKPTKPAIGEVHLYISAYRSLRANCEYLADDEHPDHEFRINRGSTHFRVKGRERHIPAVATAAKDGRSRLESRHSAARWAARARARIAELDQEIDRLQRTDEAIVVATGAPRQRVAWVVRSSLTARRYGGTGLGLALSRKLAP
jgi:hypothetical protein